MEQRISGKRTAFAALYAGLIAAPAVISYAAGINFVDGGWVYEAGQLLSLLAFPIFALQPLLAARFGVLDRLFGLDRVMRFHRSMAIAAGVMILLHPILLAAGLSWWSLLFGFDLPWYLLAGKAVLFASLLILLSSLLIRTLGIAYEKWRGAHNILSLLIIAGGFVHSLFSGSDLAHPVMRLIWALFLAAGIGAHLYHKALVPRLLDRRPFTVSQVRQENDSVWTLSFVPSDPARALKFEPGQFQFITLPGPDGRREEHPFTISGAAAGGVHCSTIKALGDFTAYAGSLPAGTPARVQGPFGRFSYRAYPGEGPLCLIAGGIGITPLMSMIRTLHEEKSTREAVLVYGNRSEGDIVFGKELEETAASGFPRLTVSHILQLPGDGWRGGRGLVDGDAIAAAMAEAGTKPGECRCFVCGPPLMMKSVLRDLRSLGVPRSMVHFERFAL